MDIKIELSLKGFKSSIVGFYSYVLQNKFHPGSTVAVLIRTPDTKELFQIIEKDLRELRNPETLAGILQILHLTIQEEAIIPRNLFYFIRSLLANHTSNDDHIIVMQMLYTILNSIPNDILVDEVSASEFVSALHESIDLNCSMLQSQTALCTKLLIEKFQTYNILEKVWNQILIKKTYSNLVHYIDLLVNKAHIYTRVEFWKVIEILLPAQNRDDRKVGRFLIRQVLEFLSTHQTVVDVDNYFHWLKAFSNQLLSSWSTYLTILENLEEKQSHLILPSLEMLENVNLGDKTSWIRILLIQILGHNNVLVLRWAVDFLFRHFSRLILANDILHEFLQATNHTRLYNENNSEDLMLPSLSPCDKERFLGAFAEVSWKSVPMHAWLLRILRMDGQGQWDDIDCKLIINTATKLRELKNYYIRSNCADIFTLIFDSNIASMDLRDFLKFIDSLYSSTDKISDEMLCILIEKIRATPSPHISYKLSQLLKRKGLSLEDQKLMMDAFEKVEVEYHEWFRVLVRFGFQPSPEQRTFCMKYYNLETEPQVLPSLEAAVSEHVLKLSWDEVSKAVVRKATADWHSSKTKIINAINRDSSPMTPAMIDQLIVELRNQPKRKVNTIHPLVWSIIENCRKDQPKLLQKYVNEILDIDVTNNVLALCVFSSADRFCDCREPEGRQLLMRGLLFGEPLCGDSRLEYDYIVRMIYPNKLRFEATYTVRKTCIQFVHTLDNVSSELLKSDLIALSRMMGIKKPRYFENSKHHRMKLRISQALAAITRKTPICDDYYLYAILHENNQTNVTYIYELIIAATIAELQLLRQLENLPQMSAKCQVSLFAISYLYILYHKCSIGFVEKIITLFLPWTMGANFSTRLYAQITIYRLLQHFQISSFAYLEISIGKSLNESPSAVKKLETDVRYNFPEGHNFLDTDPILYVTVVPEDEHESSQLEYLSNVESLRLARNLNLAKRESAKKGDDSLFNKPAIEDVQRKMNPKIGLTDVVKDKPDMSKSDMIVVASLIDKLPNLGGIARTCEVLGLKNVVLNSLKHTQSKEFKSLSMTAENWIIIAEVKPNALKSFLITKKIEGYSIVGAEQTSKSTNFMEFNFPNKCVLLLGHEKEGIPANLIALLDYAVEIPQFGMVRSLNVHVTGALFIYEYCKQHIYSSNSD